MESAKACRVPGCSGRGAYGICWLHRARAIGRGLDFKRLTSQQLAGLAKLLRRPVPGGACRVPGCERAGPRNLCADHTVRARYRGFDLLRLSAEQLATLAAIVPRERLARVPCRVPGCRLTAASGLCRTHSGWARSRGLDLKSLTSEQLASLAKGSLIKPIPFGPCRVPGCDRHGARHLCPPHMVRARALNLRPSALTAKQLASLAKPDATRSSLRSCRVPGCLYFGRDGLCQRHQARARAKDLDEASLTWEQLASLSRW